jgi:sortase A
VTASAPAQAPPPAPAERPRRRGRGALAALLMIGGALLVLDAALTVTWQEPVSWAYARVQQERLAARLEEPPPLAPAERRVVSRLDERRRLAFSARAVKGRAGTGEPLGRVRIPSIGVSTVFVAGTDTDSLRSGPGHYPGTPLPGARGTVAIAGHRTTYGAPFRNLDRLRRGERVDVQTSYGRFGYTVERTRIVAPTALWVTRRVGHDRLVLTACHPLYSAAQRIVVFARLTSSRAR